jgi:hypothetical protein
MVVPVVLPHNKLQPRRLLDIATPLPPVEGNGNSQRWLEGVTFDHPDGCGDLTVAEADDPCASEAVSTVSPLGCGDWTEVTPFRISLLFQAKILTMGETAAYAAQRLEADYRRMLSAFFAIQLVQGGNGAALVDLATAPTQGQAFADAAVPVYQAIGILDSTIADRLHGGMGYIHMPPLLMGRAVREAGVCLEADGNYYTACGNLVICDAGYDTNPAPNGTAPADMNGWIYSSSEVFWETTAAKLFDATLHHDQTSPVTTSAGFKKNQFEQLIEGYGVILTDECAVSAVQATLAEV